MGQMTSHETRLEHEWLNMYQLENIFDMKLLTNNKIKVNSKQQIGMEFSQIRARLFGGCCPISASFWGTASAL